MHECGCDRDTPVCTRCVPSVHCPAPRNNNSHASLSIDTRAETGWFHGFFSRCVHVIAYLASSLVKEHLSCFWHCAGGGVTNKEAKSTLGPESRCTCAHITDKSLGSSPQEPELARVGFGDPAKSFPTDSGGSVPSTSKERDSAGRVFLSSLQKTSLKLTRGIFYLRAKTGAGVLTDIRP